jgi:hypothetical protein
VSTIPGSWILTTAGAVEVTYLSSALTIAGPVVTGMIAAVLNQTTIQGRASEDVVLVRRVAATIYHITIFG